MTSTRAQGVAEVLWELKRAAKIGAFTPVARRAGFSAGSKGRAMMTCMKSVRRDWPHLEWWRAVPDDGKVEKNSEHANMLIEAGFDISDDDDSPQAANLRGMLPGCHCPKNVGGTPETRGQ